MRLLCGKLSFDDGYVCSVVRPWTFVWAADAVMGHLKKSGSSDSELMLVALTLSWQMRQTTGGESNNDGGASELVARVV